MKKFIVFLFLVVYFLFPGRMYAQRTLPVGSQDVTVSAAIGEYYLDISGYISPYASIILTTLDGVYLRSVTADRNGYFYITGTRIRKGFNGFCLQAIDFKRIGESTTCIPIPPATGSVTKKDLFLPPTLGLYRTDIAAGSNALAFGYTMPGAKVTLHLSDGTTLTTTADSNGYYEFTISNVKAGTYKLYATAKYKGKESLAPSKTLVLHALSWWELFWRWLADLWKKFVELLTAWKLGPLWIGLPLLLLITFLIIKLWPERFTWIYESRLVRFFTKVPPKGSKMLHHAWFVGY